MAHMSRTQLLALKAAILAETDPTFVGYRNANDKPSMAAWYNQNHPTFIVWKSRVSITQIGDNIVGTELSGLTSLNVTRLQAIAQFSADGVNPSLSDRRAFFDDVFSGAGGVGTRAKLLILWKRAATRFERLFATGTGSDVSPATLVQEGAITSEHIGEALETV